MSRQTPGVGLGLWAPSSLGVSAAGGCLRPTGDGLEGNGPKTALCSRHDPATPPQQCPVWPDYVTRHHITPRFSQPRLHVLESPPETGQPGALPSEQTAGVSGPWRAASNARSPVSCLLKATSCSTRRTTASSGGASPSAPASAPTAWKTSSAGRGTSSLSRRRTEWDPDA